MRIAFQFISFEEGTNTCTYALVRSIGLIIWMTLNRLFMRKCTVFFLHTTNWLNVALIAIVLFSHSIARTHSLTFPLIHRNIRLNIDLTFCRHLFLATTLLSLFLFFENLFTNFEHILGTSKKRWLPDLSKYKTHLWNTKLLINVFLFYYNQICWPILIENFLFFLRCPIKWLRWSEGGDLNGFCIFFLKMRNEVVVYVKEANDWLAFTNSFLLFSFMLKNKLFDLKFGFYFLYLVSCEHISKSKWMKWTTKNVRCNFC